jgi:hypothetical protein
MKKFTTLKEDLLNEAIESQKSFNEGYENANNKLERIKTALDDFQSEFENDPRNWGYSGSMGHVNELLDEILGFLGIVKEK